MLLGQSAYHFRVASDHTQFPCQESCTNHFRGTSPSEDREFDGCPTSMFDAGHPIRIDEMIDLCGHLMSLLEHLKKQYNKYYY